MDTRDTPSGRLAASSTLTFDRGFGPLVAFLLVTSAVATLVPLYVYPNLGLWPSLVAMVLAFVVVSALAWLVLRYEGLTAADVGLGRPEVLPGIAVVAGVYLFVNVVAAILAFRSTGTVRFVVPGDTSAAVWLGVALAQVLAVGITEEFAFRAYVQNKLVAAFGGGDDRVRRAAAILFGVFLFALWHIPQRVFGQGLTAPGEIIGTLVVVVVLGTLLGVLYETTRNVVLGGVLHGTFNWSFVFVADAPGDVPFLAAIPVFVVLVWYYRRWANRTHASRFAPQVQARVAR